MPKIDSITAASGAPSFRLSTAPARAVLFLFNVIETSVLRESRTSEFSHSLGQRRKWRRLHATSALPPTTDISRVLRRRSAKHSADQNRRSVSRYHPSTLPPSWCSQGFDARLRLALASR